MGFLNPILFTLHLLVLKDMQNSIITPTKHLHIYYLALHVFMFFVVSVSPFTEQRCEYSVDPEYLQLVPTGFLLEVE
jgi:hypothetical protein